MPWTGDCPQREKGPAVAGRGWGPPRADPDDQTASGPPGNGTSPGPFPQVTQTAEVERVIKEN